MARANFQFNGFQYYGSVYAGVNMNTVQKQVATGYATAIFSGDPVKKLSDGSVVIAAAGSDPIYGIVTACHYRDVNGNLVDRNYVPASTAYTVDRLRTVVDVIPCYPGVWFKVTTNLAPATPTVVFARTLVDFNADHVATAAGDLITGRSGYQLAIAGAATTAKQWRLVMPLPDPSIDLTAPNATWVVECNNSQNLPGVFSTTGI